MDRRKFIRNSTVAITAASVYSKKIFSKTHFQEKKFNLKFAPHIGMFDNLGGKDPIDQIKFMADQGFTALEDNYLKGRDPAIQNRIGETLSNLNMEMGVFVGGRIKTQNRQPALTLDKENVRLEFLSRIKDSIEASKRVNAKWMTVLPGYLDQKQDLGYQTVNVIEVLKRAAELLEPHNLTMVIEPLNFYNHPGLFLTKISQAYEICKAVDSPTCKILFDIYHQQIQEGNLIPNMELAWDEIGYFQIGDNPGRNEPTTGEINYKNIFKFIFEKGYTGILGMEHHNSMTGAAGETAVINAYREVDME